MEEELIGAIKLFAGGYAPQGYVECNGQLLNIRENEALYVLLQDRYGATPNLFAVPKMTPPMDGMKYIIAIRGIWPARQ